MSWGEISSLDQLVILGDAIHFVWLLVPLSIAGLIILLVWQLEKRRTERFANVAIDLNLPFFPEGDEALQQNLEKFHLFSQGRSRRITNMLHGKTENVEVAIFDYRYTTGGGQNSHTYKQSVAYFCSDSLNLPDFEMRPENAFHKIGSAFGYQDIDFSSHPKFSGKYLLRGEDEGAVRELYQSSLLEFFESQDKISVEGQGTQILVYRSGKRIEPAKTKEFMQEGFRVLGRFSAGSGRG